MSLSYGPVVADGMLTTTEATTEVPNSIKTTNSKSTIASPFAHREDPCLLVDLHQCPEYDQENDPNVDADRDFDFDFDSDSGCDPDLDFDFGKQIKRLGCMVLSPRNRLL